MKKFKKLLVLSNAEQYFDGKKINIRSGFEAQIFSFLDYFDTIEFLSPTSHIPFNGIDIPSNVSVKTLDFDLPDGKYQLLRNFFKIRSSIKRAIQSNLDADLALIFLPDSYLGYFYSYYLKDSDIKTIVRVTNDTAGEFLTRKPTIIRKIIYRTFARLFSAFEAQITRHSIIVFTGEPHFKPLSKKFLSIISTSVSDTDICIRNSNERSRKIGFVGRLDSNKGADIFLEIANQLPDYKFEIIGYGTKLEDDHFKEIVKECKNVDLLGFQPKNVVLERMRCWDYIIIPSRSEYQGKVQLEAMASGCIVIASDILRIRLTVENEKNGMLVPLSTDAFIQAITLLDQNDERRLNLRKNGYEYIKENTTEKMAESIINFTQ